MTEERTAKAIHILVEMDGGVLHQVHLTKEQRETLDAIVPATMGTLRIGPAMEAIYIEQPEPTPRANGRVG